MFRQEKPEFNNYSYFILLNNGTSRSNWDFPHKKTPNANITMNKNMLSASIIYFLMLCEINFKNIFNKNV